MARPAKLEVAAINVRIPSDKNRDYVGLLSNVYALKRGVKISGSTYLAVSQFDQKSSIGVLSKYTEIDRDGDWFDIEDFEIATPEKLEEVVIPQNLRPNHSAFYFKLDADLHVITFETYSESKSISSLSVEKFFRTIFSDDIILSEFGRVEADSIKSFNAVENILSNSNLRELTVIIRRPNTDELAGDFAAEIEKLMEEENSEEFEQSIKSKDIDGLRPSKRTQALAKVAAENGEVTAKSIDNGIVVPLTTRENPERIRTTFMSDQESARAIFLRLASEMAEKIVKWRDELRGTDGDVTT